MASVLEWFQCKSCGRRHRWAADIAGSEIECPCGTRVPCPRLEDVEDEPDHTDPLDSAIDAPLASGVAIAGQPIPIEGDDAPITYQRKRRGGFLGMGRFGEAVLWTVGAAIGLALLAHAIFVQWPVYIGLTVVWLPISVIMCRKKVSRWQGNRSLVRALEEEFDSED